MIEHNPVRTFIRHLVLALGVIIVMFPVYIAFVASTLDLASITQAPMPFRPGPYFFSNYVQAIFEGSKNLGSAVGVMMKNSFIMAMGISIGKIIISLLAAFAIVFFRFPGQNFFFWAVFVTLMLPIEVRIMPSYKVISDLGMLNSYVGLILPMMVSATGVFLFRQFFKSIPREIVEAAQMDGSSPMRFFMQILVPMTKTSIAAMFVIQFLYGWNQYLWPLLITTEEKYYTLLIGINRMLAVGDQQAEWQIIMATTILAMLPPVLVVISMQKQFVKGMTETEK
ncbi:MAG: sn-glycerol-3-phosphate ABC transporter permease UgpE [Spirochaetales bacterium]